MRLALVLTAALAVVHAQDSGAHCTDGTALTKKQKKRCCKKHGQLCPLKRGDVCLDRSGEVAFDRSGDCPRGTACYIGGPADGPSVCKKMRKKNKKDKQNKKKKQMKKQMKNKKNKKDKSGEYGSYGGSNDGSDGSNDGSYDYNCFTKESWSDDKIDWCCSNLGLGCPPDQILDYVQAP